ncbi:MAG TPA: hypothetical protein P5123_10265 [Spirochaetota bacterium]|nr:hypothetical protein [Spirochaetota bacterium]
MRNLVLVITSFITIILADRVYAFPAYDGTFSFSASADNETENDTKLNPGNILDMGYPTGASLNSDIDIRLLMHRNFTFSIANSSYIRYNYYTDKPEDGETWEHDNTLKQLFGTFHAGEHLIIDAGKKTERNGIMFFRNPSDFFQTGSTTGLSRSKEERDADLEGSVLVKGEIFIGSNVSVNAVFSPEYERVDNSITQIQCGISYQFDAADFTLTGYKGDVYKLGTSASANIGTSAVIRGEASVSEEKNRFTLSKGTTAPNDPNEGIYYKPEESIMRRPWEASVGGQYTFKDGSDLYAEYYYNHAGYTDIEWNDLMKVIDQCSNVSQFYNRISMLQLNGVIRDNGGITAARRHYLFFRYSKNDIIFEDFNFAAATVIGLENAGGLLTLSPQYEISNNTSLKGDATFFGGEDESEFELMYHRMSFEIMIEYVF